MPLTETPPDSVREALRRVSFGSANGRSTIGYRAGNGRHGDLDRRDGQLDGGDHRDGHESNGEPTRLGPDSSDHAARHGGGTAVLERPVTAREILADEENGDSGADAGEVQDEPRLSLATDIAVDGHYGERWLIVDRSHVRVITPTPTGGASVDIDLPLTEIKEAKTESLVGISTLQFVMKDGRVIEALRFTLARAQLFNAAARAIEFILKEEEVPDSLTANIKSKKCPNCGDPLPEDTNVCPKCVDKRAVLGRLLGYALPYRSRALLVATLMLSLTGFSLVSPLVQRHLIDDVLVPHRHVERIGWMVLGILLVQVVTLGLTIWRGRIAAWMSHHMVYTIRMQAYSRLQQLSLSYYDKRQIGSLMARVTQDVGELQQFLVDGIQFFLVNSLQIAGILLICLICNWKLTLLVLIPVPLTVWMTRVVWRRMWGRWHRMWHMRASMNASINAALSGVRVVKAFAQEDRENARFRQKAGKVFDAGVDAEQSTATYFPIINLVSTLGTYVIWLIGGREVFANHANLASQGMTLGILTMFLTYIGMLMMPLQGLTRIADWLSRATASAERVFEVIDAETDVKVAENAVAMPRVEGRVELRNVRFSYDKNANVLEDVSIDVAPGEMIGLVGHSGAGKSTIINLITRFYDVHDGSVLIDGVDIREIDPTDLRHQIGVVLQEPFLFPGTITENIAYAKPGATPIEIMRAAKAANAHEFIMRFPDGYDTYVGERGARLSGGERQRISIARAILHDPRILILDEATASVDTETEKQIQDAIGRLVQGRTTFAIAHRLSTLRNASRLMVMERGKLVEMGTHDELLAMPEGVFKRLVDMQQQVNELHAV